MNTKIVTAALLGFTLLTGCATVAPSVEQAPWGENNTVMIAETKVALSSNLWINAMPSATAKSDHMVNVALYIESKQGLSANLAVTSVTLRQGEQVWVIAEDEFELRTHSDSQWEVALLVEANIDDSLPVDVAVSLGSNDKMFWLIDRNIKVDTVY